MHSAFSKSNPQRLTNAINQGILRASFNMVTHNHCALIDRFSTFV